MGGGADSSHRLRAGDMKTRHFHPGSLVAKINWDNKVIDHGVVVQQDLNHALTDTQVLFPSGLRWEAAHDLIGLEDLPPSCN